MCGTLTDMGIRLLLLVSSLLLGFGLSVSADESPVSGFSTEVTGELSGRVVDSDGEPLRAIEVHVVTGDGEQIVVTDGDGRYRVDLKKTPGLKTVFVRRVAKLTAETVALTTIESQEVFEIQEAMLPKVKPVAISETNSIPGYSKAARDRNVWAKAWLVLDLDIEGRVQRVKIINSPGYDLDVIALRHAFKLRFKPARDARDRPVRAMVLWSYEWPSYSWMVDNRFALRQLPEQVDKVPCRGADLFRPVYRDCTSPDVGSSASQPWKLPSDVEPEPPVTTRTVHSWFDDNRLGWTLIGTGGTLAVAATILLITANNLEANLDSESDPLVRERKQDNVKSRRLRGYILGGVGIALLGAGSARILLKSDGVSSTSVIVAGRF